MSSNPGGTPNNAYPLNSEYVYNIFDTETFDPNNVFTPGTLNNFPTYSVIETGNYLINATLPFTYEQPSNIINEATWSLQVYKKNGNIETLVTSSILYFKSGDPPTSTLTFTSYQSGIFRFDLSEAIPSTDIVIVAATVNGYTTTNCSGGIVDSDDITGGNPLTIPAGLTSGTVVGNYGPSGLPAGTKRYKKENQVDIQGLGTFNDGDTFTIGDTTVTLDITGVGSCLFYAN